MTPELCMQWKKKKFAEREACFAELTERASNDRLRFSSLVSLSFLFELLATLDSGYLICNCVNFDIQ